MPFWFYCSEHGKFSIKEIFSGESADSIFLKAKETFYLPCPTCNKICKPCKQKSDRIGNCVYCSIGKICPLCGTDLR